MMDLIIGACLVLTLLLAPVRAQCVPLERLPSHSRTEYTITHTVGQRQPVLMLVLTCLQDSVNLDLQCKMGCVSYVQQVSIVK